MPAPLSEHRSASPALVLAILCVANFMATLDLFVVNVALRDIGVGFGGNALTNVSWVLNAYAIFFGALLIPAGRLADRFGRKGFFITGLGVFTLASLACAVSPDLWTLVGFRCLQAAGAAILVPSSLGLVLTSMSPERVLKSVRLWAVSGAVAGAAGPVVGGLLTQANWRWIFVLNLPVGIITALAGLRLLPDVRHNLAAKIPDPFESVMVIIGAGALSLGLVKGPDWGWASGKTIAAWIVTVVAAGLFYLINRAAAEPVVDPKLFRSRVFSAASIGIILVSAAIGMQLLGLSLYLQQSWHWSALATGAAIAPAPVMVFTASFAGHQLNEKFRPGRVAAAGFVILGLGQALVIVTLSNAHSYPGAILPGWLLIGTGGGLTVPTIIGSATSDLAKEVSATGSAVVQMARQIGSVLGTAVLVAVLGSAVITGAQARFLDAWWVTAGICAAGAVAALFITPHRQAVPAPGPAGTVTAAAAPGTQPR